MHLYYTGSKQGKYILMITYCPLYIPPEITIIFTPSRTESRDDVKTAKKIRNKWLKSRWKIIFSSFGRVAWALAVEWIGKIAFFPGFREDRSDAIGFVAGEQLTFPWKTRHNRCVRSRSANSRFDEKTRRKKSTGSARARARSARVTEGLKKRKSKGKRKKKKKERGLTFFLAADVVHVASLNTRRWKRQPNSHFSCSFSPPGGRARALPRRTSRRSRTKKFAADEYYAGGARYLVVKSRRRVPRNFLCARHIGEIAQIQFKSNSVSAVTFKIRALLPRHRLCRRMLGQLARFAFYRVQLTAIDKPDDYRYDPTAARRRTRASLSPYTYWQFEPSRSTCAPWLSRAASKLALPGSRWAQNSGTTGEDGDLRVTTTEQFLEKRKAVCESRDDDRKKY